MSELLSFFLGCVVGGMLATAVIVGLSYLSHDEDKDD